MPLQLVFAGEILYKDCDDKGSRRLKLVKTSLRVLIADIVYIKAWTVVLILPLSILILTIFICLVRASFWIFFYKSAVFKVKSNITPEYIIAYRKVLKRSTSNRKSLSELKLSSTFYK